MSTRAAVTESLVRITNKAGKVPTTSCIAKFDSVMTIFEWFCTYCILTASAVCWNYTDEGDADYEDERIVGGLPAWIERYPFVVSLQVNGHHVCAGTLISRQHVLTAAHCLQNNDTTVVHETNLQVRVGSTWDNKEGQMMRVRSVVLNPDYDSKISGDLAVVELAGKVKGNKGVVLAGPNDTAKLVSMMDSGMGCSVLGWGSAEPKPYYRHYLQIIHLFLMSWSQCQCYFPQENFIKTEAHICTSSNNWFEWPCYLDPGSPLLCEGKQYGTAVFSRRCGDKSGPAIFNRVDTSSVFIKDAMERSKGILKSVNTAHVHSVQPNLVSISLIITLTAVSYQ